MWYLAQYRSMRSSWDSRCLLSYRIQPNSSTPSRSPSMAILLYRIFPHPRFSRSLLSNISLSLFSFAPLCGIDSSMEIGSAYALQVCLLQIPALVAVSAFLNGGKVELQESTFSLIFPRWDLITVILCVFLLAYMYGEGKSNYFKVPPSFGPAILELNLSIIALIPLPINHSLIPISHLCHFIRLSVI
jgi:hypothetical protein